MCDNDQKNFSMLISNNSSSSLIADQRDMVGMLCFVSSSNKDASNNKRNKRKSSSGSSGSGSSVPGAKSAPPTPHGDRLQPGSSFPPASTPDPPSSSDQPPPRSPSHIFTKNDKQALKQLSSSTPTMTAAPPAGGAPEPEVVVASTPPGSSKARQKKFHRHFKQVPAEERVLNYYSCALVSDILLQGHLYITKNYFAFYSNVFGYVTKLLIPTASVLKVSKEKTAKIIPNAVGIATLHEKHVFGSLLSRDATFKLMIQVWKTATEPEAVEDVVVVPKLEPSESKEEVVSTASIDAVTVDDEDSSLSGSGNDDSAIERSLSPTPIDTPTDAGSLSESKDTPRSSRVSTTLKSSVPDGPKTKHCEKLVDNGIPVGVTLTTTSVPIQTLQNHIRNSYNSVQSMPRPTLILLVSTGLLAMLFISAALLLYRISAIQSQFAMHPVIANSGDVYQEILKWQIQLHSKSSNEVQQFLNNNLDQIAKVRQSLEALSLLIVSEDEIRQRHQHSHPSGVGGGGPSVADLSGEVTQETSRGAS